MFGGRIVVAKHRSWAFFLCLFWAVSSLYAQDFEQKPAWYSQFFLEGAMHYHFSPDPLSGAIGPKPGFRGALGYEWDKLRIFASSGYSLSDGTDPLVTSFSFVPLTIGAGYALPIKGKWGAQADLGLGVQLLRASHYESWLDLAGERPRESTETKLFAEGRLYATYSLLKFLRIYAGGGVDMTFETSAPVFFPALEAGISLKPLRSLPPPKPPVERPVLPPSERPVSPPSERPVLPSPARTASFRHTVYFQPNSGTEIVALYRPLLNEVGKQMQENPDTRLVLRGYAAPFDTMEGQITISAARVWYCTEYLIREYGIDEERIRMAFFGVGETSPPEGAGINARRRVELFAEPLEAPRTGDPLLRPSVIGDEPGWVVPVRNTIYFEEGSGTRMIEPYLPQLREVGRFLRNDPQARLVLRGYSSHSGTSEGQITRSAARIWACAEFLEKEYGIPESRIRMAFFGAEGISPEERVDIIVEEPGQFHYAVHFEGESGTRILDGLPLLRDAGRRLESYPDTRLVVRGYAGTEDGRITAVSAARVWYCTEFLKKEYNIPEDRIRMAFFGAGEVPGTGNVRRRVELFPEPVANPLIEEPLLKPSAEMRVGADAGNWGIPMRHTVHFEAGSGIRMLDEYLPMLQEAGRLLRADYQTRITLRGYAAPDGSAGGQIARSAARAWFCAEYLMKEYGISERRIRTAFFGAEGMTAAERGEWNLRRRVEVIVEEPKPERMQYTVYFESDSGLRILENSLPVLRAAGERLSVFPKTNVTLRGYAAPVGTEESQRVISAARAWSCAEYLMREYGISEGRIRFVSSGAEGTSGTENTGLNRHRRVDITVEQD
jgi:outer membrane protein OmpA-like peptidoglycan-associated protein